MNKNKKLGWMIFVISFVVASVVVFAIPTDKTASFWVAYVFTCIAFAAQCLIWTVGIKDNTPLKSKFLGIPIIRMGYVYLSLQLIVLLVALLYPYLPPWMAVVICALIAGISAACMTIAEIGRNVIGNVEAKVNTKVSYIKEIQTDIEMAAECESDVATRQKLLKLAEKVRYSDPVSSGALSEMEQKIADKVKSITGAYDKPAIIEEIELLLLERNKKCKIYKDM